VTNFYQLLEISLDASEAQIHEQIKKKYQHWHFQQQNGTSSQRRHEATVNIEAIPQIQQTLLNPHNRAAYDRQLRAASGPQQRMPHQAADAPERASASSSAVSQKIEAAGRLLDAGKVADALSAAEEAVRMAPANADAHALHGECLLRWGDGDSAIAAFSSAINISKQAVYYYQRGLCYVAKSDWSRAELDFQRAITIGGEHTEFRAALGAALLGQDKLDEGIGLLEAALSKEPGREDFKSFLASGYLSKVDHESTPVGEGMALPPGWYALDYPQLQRMENLVIKAENLRAENPETVKAVAAGRQKIDLLKSRRFQGNWFSVAVLTLLGLAALREAPLIGLSVLTLTVLYYVSCRTPEYLWCSRILRGKTATLGHYLEVLLMNAGRSNLYVDSRGHVRAGASGFVTLILGMIIVLLLMPIVALVNYYYNYVRAGQARGGFAAMGGVALASALVMPVSPAWDFHTGPAAAVHQQAPVRTAALQQNQSAMQASQNAMRSPSAPQNQAAARQNEAVVPQHEALRATQPRLQDQQPAPASRSWDVQQSKQQSNPSKANSSSYAQAGGQQDDGAGGMPQDDSQYGQQDGPQSGGSDGQEGSSTREGPAADGPGGPADGPAGGPAGGPASGPGGPAGAPPHGAPARPGRPGVPATQMIEGVGLGAVDGRSIRITTAPAPLVLQGVEPFDQRAVGFLTRLISKQKISCHQSNRGGYYCVLMRSGKDIGAELIVAGLAQPSPEAPPRYRQLVRP
jgi:tetratricopeptide (TPR) repeat protein